MPGKKVPKPVRDPVGERAAPVVDTCAVGFTWAGHVPTPFVFKEGDQSLAREIERFFLDEWDRLAAQHPADCRAFEVAVREWRWSYSTSCDATIDSGRAELRGELQALVLDAHVRPERLIRSPYIAILRFKRNGIEPEGAQTLFEQRDDPVLSQIGPAWNRLRTENRIAADAIASLAGGTKWLLLGHTIGGEHDEYYTFALTIMFQRMAAAAEIGRAPTRIAIAKKGQQALEAMLLAYPPEYATLIDSREEIAASDDGEWTVREHGASSRRSIDKAVESLEAAEVRGEVLPDDLMLRLASLPNLREAIVRGREQGLVQHQGLEPDAIRELVAKGDSGHAEACRRFAAAREALGLDALQAPFDSYQEAVVGGPAQRHPTRESKQSVVSRLNSVAEALCAMFEVDGYRGRLAVSGAPPGTFQIRSHAKGAGKPLGLGQRLPALRLRAGH